MTSADDNLDSLHHITDACVSTPLTKLDNNYAFFQSPAFYFVFLGKYNKINY